MKLDVVTATIGDRNATKGCGISTGRYVLIKEIRAGESSSGNPDESASADSDTEGYAGKSVKELMEDSGGSQERNPHYRGSSADTDTVGGGQGTESGSTMKQPELLRLEVLLRAVRKPRIPVRKQVERKAIQARIRAQKQALVRERTPAAIQARIRRYGRQRIRHDPGHRSEVRIPEPIWYEPGRGETAAVQ